MLSGNEKIVNPASIPKSCSPMQTCKFRYEHWLHIASITSNYNAELIPVKHRVTMLNVYICLLSLQGLKGWNLIWIHVESIICQMLSSQGKDTKPCGYVSALAQLGFWDALWFSKSWTCLSLTDVQVVNTFVIPSRMMMSNAVVCKDFYFLPERWENTNMSCQMFLYQYCCWLSGYLLTNCAEWGMLCWQVWTEMTCLMEGVIILLEQWRL